MQSKAKLRAGKLIVLEGADGVGKSTLAAELAQYIGNAGQETRILSFPGREPATLGNLVYAIHHEPMRFGIRNITEASKQLLHIAAHIDVIGSIQALLRSGHAVILDRYWWSTWVYGRTAGVPVKLLGAMINVEREAWGHTSPELVVLVRRRGPIGRDVNLTDWQRLQGQYSDLAARENKHVPVLLLDDPPSTDVACKAIVAALSSRPGPPLDIPRQESLIDVSSPDLRLDPPVVLTHLSPLKATTAYDTYWRFAAERQEIFFKRLEGHSAPWTQDAILQTFKFTNAYRAADRVSQFLIRRVIYNEAYPADLDEVFFRILLFKLFNKIATWELLERSIGRILHSEYSYSRYDDILTQAMARGERIYSGAYIMPSGGRILGSNIKHRNHLMLLERMMADRAPAKIQEARTMHEGFDILLGYPTIGEFLAYQFIIDLNYSSLASFDENDFVVPGPGALDGIRKCFIDLGGLNEPELIRFIVDQQEREFARLGLHFRSLWGRPLKLIDCQNVFCEVDKYSRVRHPELIGISGRTRIKQRFSRNLDPIAYWFPPKWGINGLIEQTPTNSPPSDKSTVTADGLLYGNNTSD